MMAQEAKKIELDPSEVNGCTGCRTTRRGFDVLASGIALILLSPLFLVLIILIKKEDGGPAFYSQERTGKDERSFKMWRLRSMIVDADKTVEQLEGQNEIGGIMFKIRDGSRVTKVDHVIRKYSLDELPQLWNVLKGDMSLVGLRPPLPIEVAGYTDYDRLCLAVTPECTGSQQVTKRNIADFDEAVELDLKYINNSSLWFDLKILLRTVGVVTHPNSAYQGEKLKT